MKKKQVRNILFYLTAAVIVVIYFFPIYMLCLSSFKSLKEIYLNVLSLPGTISFANFAEALDGMDYFKTLPNSLIVSGSTAILTALFASMAAWVLVRYRCRVSDILYIVFASSMLIPFQCVMLPLMRMLNSAHMTNRAGLVFSYLGLFASMAVILVHGYIKSIPVEIEESAAIDGCTMPQIFFKIVFPMLKPILVTVAILSIINTWNDYLLPSLIINKAGMQTLPLKTYMFISQFVKRWDIASAGMVLCIIPIMIFYITCQKYIIRGVTSGAIKG